MHESLNGTIENTHYSIDDNWIRRGRRMYVFSVRCKRRSGEICKQQKQLPGQNVRKQLE